MYKIYALINPKTLIPFYVGITTRPIEDRLNGHINSPMKLVKDYMITNNIIPIVSLIKETDNRKDESYIISEYSKNYQLCNIRDNYEIKDRRNYCPKNGEDPNWEILNNKLMVSDMDILCEILDISKNSLYNYLGGLRRNKHVAAAILKEGINLLESK